MHNRIPELEKLVRNVPDFPKKGIMFRDITSILNSKEGINLLTYVMEAQLNEEYFNKIVAIESRGFLLGSILASIYEVPLVLARKPGKLPNETLQKKYSLEYGENALCIQTCDINESDKNILIVDDLIATGGSARAACDIVEALGGRVEACYFLIELNELRGRKLLEEKDIKVISSIEY